jgi:hypothetical protein
VRLSEHTVLRFGGGEGGTWWPSCLRCNTSFRTMVLRSTASNRKEYQEYVLRSRGRCFVLTNLTPSRAECLQIWQPQTPGPQSALPVLRFGLHKNSKEMLPVGKHGSYKTHTAASDTFRRGMVSSSIRNPFSPHGVSILPPQCTHTSITG